MRRNNKTHPDHLRAFLPACIFISLLTVTPISDPDETDNQGFTDNRASLHPSPIMQQCTQSIYCTSLCRIWTYLVGSAICTQLARTSTNSSQPWIADWKRTRRKLYLSAEIYQSDRKHDKTRYAIATDLLGRSVTDRRIGNEIANTATLPPIHGFSISWIQLGHNVDLERFRFAFPVRFGQFFRGESVCSQVVWFDFRGGAQEARRGFERVFGGWAAERAEVWSPRRRTRLVLQGTYILSGR